VLIFSEQTPKYLEQLFGDLNAVLVAERSVFVRWSAGEAWEPQCSSVGPNISWSSVEQREVAAVALQEATAKERQAVAAAAAADLRTGGGAPAPPSLTGLVGAAPKAAQALEQILLDAGELAAKVTIGETEGAAAAADQEDQEEAEDAPASHILREVLPLLEYYTERTPGSVIEAKASSIAWNYRACDLDHGQWQAKELQMTLNGMSQRMAIHVRHAKKVVEVRVTEKSGGRVKEEEEARERENVECGSGLHEACCCCEHYPYLYPMHCTHTLHYTHHTTCRCVPS
jgi:trehalose-6-phosphatase